MTPTDTGVAPTDTSVAPTDTGVAPTDTDVATDATDDDTGETAVDTTVADTVDDGDVEPVVLAAPTEVSATTDRTSDVLVRWEAVPGATGYLVERCDGATCAAGDWQVLTAAAITVATYTDGDVEVPALPPAPTASATTNRTDDVRVTWGPVAAPVAARYRYRIVALDDAGESPASEVVVGGPAERPVLGYEVRIDGGAWTLVPGDAATATWTDDEAPAATVSAGTASATQAVHATHVALAVTGAGTTPGAQRSYAVRAYTANGWGPSSAAATGRRVATGLAYAWERSAGTSPQGFAVIEGATGTTYNDTGAPADGSVRWYRVVVSATGAEAQTSAAVAGSREPPPGGGPAAVTATSDLQDMVRVTWQAVAGATGYRVYREGVELTSGGGVSTTSYEDRAIAGPASGWLAPTGVAATSDDPGGVTVAWIAPVQPVGPSAVYTVRAVNAAGDGPLSSPATGRRAAPALTGYEVQLAPSGGSATWVSVGNVTSWDHVDAPRPSIVTGTASATTGDHRKHVRLTLTGAGTIPAATVGYTVRGLLVGGTTTPTSTSATGQRAVGALVITWQRSAGTTASGFADLTTTALLTYDDTTAPPLGDHRWYRANLAAEGADLKTVSPVEGWRLAFIAVDGGRTFSCAVTADRDVWCWGSNVNGQLGRGAAGAGVALPAEANFPGGATVARIAVAESRGSVKGCGNAVQAASFSVAG